MGKQNGATGSRNNSKRTNTKFGNFVNTKRSKRNIVVDDTPINTHDADGVITSDSILESDTFDTVNGIVTETSESGNGSGSDGDGRSGRRNGDGRSNGDSDNSPANPKRRGRRSAEDRATDFIRENPGVTIEEARKIIETQKKPRKVKSFSDNIADGVAGSAILLGGIFEGGSHLLAMALSNKEFDRSYFRLEKDESHNLGDAVLKVLEAQSKYNRKRFDEFMKKLYPYWNLAKVCTEIGYPRYEMYKMELEYKLEIAKQANAKRTSETTASNADSTKQTTDTSFDPIDSNSSWPIQ